MEEGDEVNKVMKGFQYACNTEKSVENVIPRQKVVCINTTPGLLFNDLTLVECMDSVLAAGKISAQWFQQ
jgi:hypothetical protein